MEKIYCNIINEIIKKTSLQLGKVSIPDSVRLNSRRTPGRQTRANERFSINSTQPLHAHPSMMIQTLFYLTFFLNSVCNQNQLLDFDPKYENHFKENQLAWKFFVKQAPSYKKVTTQWIMAAKQEKTRLLRLE